MEAGRGRRPCGCLRSRRALHHPSSGGATGVFSDQVLNLFSLTPSAFIEGADGADGGRPDLLLTTCGKAGQAR